ncbi:MAG: hypothetical protein COB02_02760 [Candidatus Cloacimonadota bacterium]|nr:MAG: hypothetical protein COB02_02760 [Candidatus Cloacimonadota bacterium]
MAVKTNKLVQYIDLGTYSIKYGTFQISKETNEVVEENKFIYKIPNTYSGPDLYMDSLGSYIKDIIGDLNKKLPIKFTCSSLFTPTNLSYLSRVDKDQVETRVKDELEKYASQEKIPIDGFYNQTKELFIKELDDKAQVISANILLNPKYVGIIKKHLYDNQLKFGGIYPALYNVYEQYLLAIESKEPWRDEAIVFVDFGYMTTKVDLFFQGKHLFNKVLHYGTKVFSDELFDFASKSGTTTLSPSDVEAVLHKIGFSKETDILAAMELDINNPAPYIANLEETLKSIFSKVNSSINYFVSALARNFTNDNASFMTIRKGPTHFLFSGGLINAKEFYIKASESFKGQIHLIDPFNFQNTLEQTEASILSDEFRSHLRENSPFVSIAQSMLLGLDQSKFNLNLIDKVDSENENLIKVLLKLPMSKYRTILVFILILSCLRSGFNYYSVSSAYNTFKRKSSKLKASLKNTEANRNELHKLKLESQLIDLKYENIQTFTKNYGHWPTLLKKLIQKLGPNIILKDLKFTTTLPQFKKNNYKKWKKSQNEKDSPWILKQINFKMSGIALSLSDVPQLIDSLKNTGIFKITKQPLTKFMPEKEIKTKSNNKGGPEIVKTESAHYTFSMQGSVLMENLL